MKPHKHAELIKAWADGAEIQERYSNNLGDSIGWSDFTDGIWMVEESYEYRIKPKQKPDVVQYLNRLSPLTNTPPLWEQSNYHITKDCIQIIWSGDGKLKSAEVLK